jgi:tetratricopeptide (TPR) repeat protein
LLQRLGNRWRHAGNTRAAERAYRRALALAERHLPADVLTGARICNDLGVLLKYTGGFDEAAVLYAQAYNTLAGALGPGHPDVATVLHNIGGLAHAAGRPADGVAAAQAAVRIREASEGPGSPQAATERAALAVLIDATGRHHEAAEILRAALAALKEGLGPDHHEVAVTLANLGATDARRGELESAERRLRRALAIKQRVLGTSHLELAPTLATLAVVLRQRDQVAEANALLRRALRLYVSRGLYDHPHTAALERSLSAEPTSPLHRARPPAQALSR